MGVSIDMLSSLPESLLSAIVSSLPFREAVRTSILSKEWVDICKSTTNIEFNEQFFVKFDQSPEIVDAQRREFYNFTRKWLENRGGNDVEKLSLRISVPTMSSQLIDQCIMLSMRSGVKDLKLDFTNPTWINNSFYHDHFVASFDLPSYVYGYGGLESLKLYSCDFVASEMVNFHSLKEISLGFMELKLCAIKALLTNCEKLESLTLCKCWISDDVFIMKEEYLRLKKLIINSCQFKSNIFKVNFPNMKVFNYHGLMNLVVFDIRLHALDEVNLNFSLEHRYQGYGFYLYEILKNVSSAKVMTVCSYLLQVIYTEGQPKRMYRGMNVKHLIMKTALHQFEFMGISFMLRSCPNLERLTIEIVQEKIIFENEAMVNVMPDKYWIDGVEVYKCVKKFLKEIEIKGFKGTKNELSVIKHFLIHGEELRKLNINLLEDGRNKVVARREAAEHFQMIPKASTNLEISIY